MYSNNTKYPSSHASSTPLASSSSSSPPPGLSSRLKQRTQREKYRGKRGEVDVDGGNGENLNVIDSLRRLQQHAFKDIMELRHRLTVTEKDTNALVAWRNSTADITVDASNEVGLCFGVHAPSTSVNSLDSLSDVEGQDLSTTGKLDMDTVGRNSNRESRTASKRRVCAWHRANLCTLILNKRHSFNAIDWSNGKNRDSACEVRMKLSTSGASQNVVFNSMELLIPTIFEKLKIKLLPLAESGRNATSGICERGVASIGQDFVTEAGASSLPFLERVWGHGAAIGFNGMKNKLMFTTSSIICPQKHTLSYKIQREDDDSECDRLASVPLNLSQDCMPREGTLSSPKLALERYFESKTKQRESEIHFKQCYLAEAAVMLSTQSSIGIVSMYGDADSFRSSESLAAGHSPRKNNLAVGIHALTLLFDKLCVRGWIARESCTTDSKTQAIAQLHGKENALKTPAYRRKNRSFGLSVSSLSAYNEGLRVGAAIGSSSTNGNITMKGSARQKVPEYRKFLSFAASHGLYGEASVVVPLNGNLRINPSLVFRVNERGQAYALFFPRIQWHS